MAFETIPSYSTSTPVITSGMAPNGWGGGAGGAALGAGVGGLLGAALGNGGLLGNNGANGVTVEKSIGDLAASVPAQTAALQHDLFTLQSAAADRGYQQTIAFGQQASAIDRDVLTVGYDTSRQMCDGFNASNVISLQNKYDTALQLCGIDHHIDKCCCEEKELIMRTAFETQLRDACYKNDTDKQLAEIKCLIKDTEKDAIIRGQAAQIAGMSQHFQTKSIQDCIKDAFCKNAAAVNQLGLNEQIINPDCKWPPFVPSLCCN